MTDPTAQMPPPPPPSGPPPPDADKPSSWWKRPVPLWALIATGLVAVGLGAATASSDEDDDEEEETAALDASTTTEAEDTTTTERRTTTTARRTTTTTPRYHEPVPEDFEVAILVTEQQCFGSAGCNVNYEIDVTYVPVEPLDPDVTYQVIYEVHGGEDGVQIGSFEVTDDEIVYDGGLISTSSADVKLTAVVTTVRGRL